MKKTRVFMLGWEFPPFISGGLGTACYGLTKAMDWLGIPIIFVLPGRHPLRFAAGRESRQRVSVEQTTLSDFTNVRFHETGLLLQPYGAIEAGPAEQHLATGRATTVHPQGHATAVTPAESHAESSCLYGCDICDQVQRYADRAARIARNEDFDIVHAHDWMTYLAGIKVADQSGKPLIVHVHSTEFDRSGEHVNQQIYDIERHGMHAADKVLAVSNYTRNLILNRYGVDGEKVEVVYNGVELASHAGRMPAAPPRMDKIVLFLGRITMQKGPDYFLRAAARVLEKMDNVKFIMAGDGDMLYRCIELASSMDIAHKVFFTRFLRGYDVSRAYRMADLYVMPSVSEPFGIAPLEALQNNVPVLVSKQSGIAERLANALKVDFWDVDEMANKITAVLKHAPLRTMLRDAGHQEAFQFRWEDAAARIRDIYEQVTCQPQYARQ